MSRKDYRAVADVLRSALEGADLEGLRVVTLIAREFSDFFKGDNSRFDRQRFMDAVFGEIT